MIICKPRKPVVYLVGTLIGIGYLLTGLGLYKIITSPHPSLFMLFWVCLLLALLIFLLIRLVTSYVKLVASPTQLTVQYLLMGQSRRYPLASLSGVEEVKIKTFQKKEFRQLIVHFGGEKITLNNQVYTNYDQLKNFLNQKKAGSKPKTFRK